MFCGKFELDPESGLRFTGKLTNKVEELFHDATPDTCPTDPLLKQDHLRALALLALVDGSGGGSRRGRADMIVVIDEQTLRTGLHEHSIVDIVIYYLSIEPFRKLAYEAKLIPSVLNIDGVLLDLCRDVRFVTLKQRLSLRSMYSSCMGPDCTVPFGQCEIH